MSLFDLSGKTAVILAGTSTLGSAMAEGLACHGAHVAITSRSQDKAATTSEAIARSCQDPARVKAFACDPTSKEDLQRLLADTLDWTGSVDVLMHCPGKNSATPFFELKMEEWDDIHDVNLRSAVLAAQVFGKQMIDQGEGGSIINVSSVAAGPPLSRVFSYAASKAGLENVTQFLAREFAPHRIRVNAIRPGFFPAEQNRKILSPDRIEAIMRHTPMERFGTPEELQGAAVWLASGTASGFVTGTVIRVDGGYGAMTI